jgi:hypothetical protein
MEYSRTIPVFYVTFPILKPISFSIEFDLTTF